MAVDLLPVDSLHIETYARLLETVKEFSSSVYNISSPIVVPFSFFGNLFTLVTEPGTRVDIIIRKTGLSGDVNTKISLIAVTAADTIVLPLGEGSNIIEITPEGGGTLEFFVSALHLASLLEADAQEIHENIELLIDEVENAILSPIGARLVEFHIPIHDLLPDVLTYRQLSTKLAIRALLQDPGTERGARDFLSAITTNTPIFVREQLEDTEFDPIEYPIFTPQEHFGGYDAHIWLTNRCAASWAAFVKLINNVDAFSLEQVTEIITTHQEYNGFRIIGADVSDAGIGYAVDDVLTFETSGADVIGSVVVTAVSGVGEITDVSVAVGGVYAVKPVDPVPATGGSGSGGEINLVFIQIEGRVVRHQFAENFDAAECSLQDLIVTCFDNVTTFMVTDVQTAGKMCIGYPLDTKVEFCGALGVRYLDCDEELDTGTLDTVEDEDPTGDGFVGYGLAQRMDGGFCFDSYPAVLHKTPAAWDDCCYIFGHAITPLAINFASVQIDEDIVIDVSLIETLGGAGLGPLLSEV